MNLNPKFLIGDKVYFASNSEHVGIVTGLLVRPDNVLQYYVTWAEDKDETLHYWIELSTERDFSV